MASERAWTQLSLHLYVSADVVNILPLSQLLSYRSRWEEAQNCKEGTIAMGTLVVLLLVERLPPKLAELLLIGESMIGINISGIPPLTGGFVL
jgi:hypothetical protein